MHWATVWLILNSLRKSAESEKQRAANEIGYLRWHVSNLCRSEVMSWYLTIEIWSTGCATKTFHALHFKLTKLTKPQSAWPRCTFCKEKIHLINKLSTEREEKRTTQEKRPYIHTKDHAIFATYTGLMPSFTDGSEYFLKKCFRVHVVTLGGHHEAASMLNCRNISKAVFTVEEPLFELISISRKEAVWSARYKTRVKLPCIRCRKLKLADAARDAVFHDMWFTTRL